MNRSDLERSIDNLRDHPGEKTLVAAIEAFKRSGHLRPGAQAYKVKMSLAEMAGVSLEHVEELIAGRRKQIIVEDTFEESVKPNGWLRDYLRWTRQTESPSAFHWYVAAAILGAVVKRNVRLRGDARALYCNLAILLVAPPAVCRKSTCINQAMGLLSPMKLVNELPRRITKESLITVLSQYEPAQGIVIADEMTTFLGRQRYNEGLVKELTKLLDCPIYYSNSTVARKEESLRDVFLTCLFGSTPTWMITGLPSEAFGGGFMRRILMVPQERTSRRFPNPSDLNEDKAEALRDFLRQLAAIRDVRLEMPPDVESWYADWYNSNLDNIPDNPQYASYWVSREDHLLRLAMIIYMSRECAPGIDLAAMEQALRVMSWTEKFLPRIYSTISSSDNVFAQKRAMILSTLERHGGTMPYRRLMSGVMWKFAGSSEFKLCLKDLGDEGLLMDIDDGFGHNIMLTDHYYMSRSEM